METPRHPHPQPATARDYDVIICGAGPAGATAALYATRLGMRVLLIDKRTFPRDKICGDAVARKSLGYLRDLGLLSSVEARTHEPIGAAVLSAPGGATVRIDLREPDTLADPHMVCRREIFDDALVTAARAEMDVMEGATVTDVLRDATDAVCGVRVKSGGAAEDRPGRSGVRTPSTTASTRNATRDRTTSATQTTTHDISARVVIGADGFNSVIARKLCVYQHDTRRWWVATRQYFRGMDTPARTVEVHYLDDTLPGFLWMFPTGDGLTNVGLGMIHRDIKRRPEGNIRRVHERAITQSRLRGRFETATPVDNVHGFNLPTPDFNRTIAGDGWLLCGDAAGLVDPFSGEGIGNAMCAGHVAAQTIARALDAASPEAARAEILAYPDRLFDALDRGELRLHYRLRGLARRRGALNFLIGRAAAHADVLQWLTTMTAANGAVSRKEKLTSPLTFLKLWFRGA